MAVIGHGRHGFKDEPSPITTFLNRLLARTIGLPGVQPADKPRRRGFGTDLIEKIVAHELRHPVELDFCPEGVRCTLLVPVREPSEFELRRKGPAAVGR